MNKTEGTCANCGKGEETSSDLKSCAACMMVKYCSRECQSAHRPQHKRECNKRAKELHYEKLFEQPPPLDDCPLCFLRLPTLNKGSVYMSCCGKIICRGCTHAVQSRSNGHPLCPFCRTPHPTKNEKEIKRLEKHMELNDAKAFYNLGGHYSDGTLGLPKDHAKALKLFHRASELGFTGANCRIGYAYIYGRGAEREENKAVHYWELAAIGGIVEARHNLGAMEGMAGNMFRALQHHMIATKDGYSNSLDNIKRLYSEGYATKDDYAKALHSYQTYLDEIKSDQRDEAAAFDDEYKYY